MPDFFKVRTVDADTGTPIPGINTTVWWGKIDGPAEWTYAWDQFPRHDKVNLEEASGCYRIPADAKSFHLIWIRCASPGFAPSVACHPLAVFKDLIWDTSFTIPLKKLLRIGGRILGQNGDPLVNAQISLIWPRPGPWLSTGSQPDPEEFHLSTTTDATGGWSLEGVPGLLPSQQLFVRHPEIAPQWFPPHANPHSRTPDSGGLPDPESFKKLTSVIHVVDGYSMEGVILDESGTPISDATVRRIQPRWVTPFPSGLTAVEPDTRSDANGRFCLRHLLRHAPMQPTGPDAIQDPNHAEFQGIVAVVEAKGYREHRFRILAGQNQALLKCTLTRGRVVSGRVMDPKGEPAAGVSIRAYRQTSRPYMNPEGEGATTTSAADGSFQFLHLPLEKVHIQAWSTTQDHGTAECPVGTTEVAIQLHHHTPQPGIAVLDATSEEPIPAFHYTLWVTTSEATHRWNHDDQGTNGRVTLFQDRGFDAIRMEVTADGYEPATLQIDSHSLRHASNRILMRRTPSTDARFRLQAATGVCGQLPPGIELKGLIVRLLPALRGHAHSHPYPRPLSFETRVPDHQGRFRFTGLQAGQYSLAILDVNRSIETPIGGVHGLRVGAGQTLTVAVPARRDQAHSKRPTHPPVVVRGVIQLAGQPDEVFWPSRFAHCFQAWPQVFLQKTTTPEPWGDVCGLQPETRSLPLRKDGAFEIDGIEPGDYRLSVRPDLSHADRQQVEAQSPPPLPFPLKVRIRAGNILVDLGKLRLRPRPWPGDPAPSFRIKTTTGRILDLPSLRGKAALLTFQMLYPSCTDRFGQELACYDLELPPPVAQLREAGILNAILILHPTLLLFPGRARFRHRGRRDLPLWYTSTELLSTQDAAARDHIAVTGGVLSFLDFELSPNKAGERRNIWRAYLPADHQGSVLIDAQGQFVGYVDPGSDAHQRLIADIANRSVVGR